MGHRRDHGVGAGARRGQPADQGGGVGTLQIAGRPAPEGGRQVLAGAAAPGGRGPGDDLAQQGVLGGRFARHQAPAQACHHLVPGLPLQGAVPPPARDGLVHGPGHPGGQLVARCDDLPGQLRVRGEPVPVPAGRQPLGGLQRPLTVGPDEERLGHRGGQRYEEVPEGGAHPDRAPGAGPPQVFQQGARHSFAGQRVQAEHAGRGVGPRQPLGDHGRAEHGVLQGPGGLGESRCGHRRRGRRRRGHRRGRPVAVVRGHLRLSRGHLSRSM